MLWIILMLPGGLPARVVGEAKLQSLPAAGKKRCSLAN